MAAIVSQFDENEDRLLRQWDDAIGSEILKDVTFCHNNKFFLVKKGTKSHKYEHFQFYFLDEDGNETSENVITMAFNPKYFSKISK